MLRKINSNTKRLSLVYLQNLKVFNPKFKKLNNPTTHHLPPHTYLPFPCLMIPSPQLPTQQHPSHPSPLILSQHPSHLQHHHLNPHFETNYPQHNHHCHHSTWPPTHAEYQDSFYQDFILNLNLSNNILFHYCCCVPGPVLYIVILFYPSLAHFLDQMTSWGWLLYFKEYQFTQQHGKPYLNATMLSLVLDFGFYSPILALWKYLDWYHLQCFHI